MILSAVTAAAAVFCILCILLDSRGRNMDIKEQRIRDIRNLRSSEQENPGRQFALSLKEIKSRIEKRKRAKIRGQQINSTRNPGKQSATDKQLQMADVPLTGIQFTIIRVAAGGVLSLGALLLCSTIGIDSSLSLLVVCAGLIAGILLPMKWLSGKVKKKQALYRDELPDLMDLLVVSVEAGLGFDAAILRLYEKDKSPLMQEMMRAIQDVQRGMSKKEAYSSMSARCGVKELTSFLNSLIQAEQMGISIKSVLKTQSEALREGRRQRAEEKALKAPVTMLIPLVIFIFPVIFIILLGPAVMNVMEVFK